MEESIQEQVSLTEGQRLRKFLDLNGYKHTWVAAKLGLTRGMFSMILSDERRLSEERKIKLETLFPTFKF